MIFDKYILHIITSAKDLLKTSITFLECNDIGILIDLLVVVFVLLCTYVIGQYVKSIIDKVIPTITKKYTSKDFIYNLEECPICLSEFKTATRMDCGHVFCLNCILTYFRTNNLRWKCTCPLCKSLVWNVTVLNQYANVELHPKLKTVLENRLNDIVNEQYTTTMALCFYVWRRVSLKHVIGIGITLFLSYMLLMSPFAKFNIRLALTT